MEKFSNFIIEQKDEPYRFVVIYNNPEEVGDDSKEETEPMAKKMIAFGNKLGLEGFMVEIDKAYVDGNSIGMEDGKKFKLDKNTIVFNRARTNDRANWQGLIYHLEHTDARIVNSMKVHNICADKFRTYTKLNGKVLQPKTVLINNNKGLETSLKILSKPFPIILKTILGTGGVGVLKIENEAQLLSSVQIINKLGAERGMVIQEFIPLEYDIRVIMVGGEIQGAMKRPIVDGDFRANVHQGSEPESMELTQREIDTCNKVKDVIGGDWVGIDLIPSKDREKQDPYVLEINSQPGHIGYDSVHKGSILNDVIKIFMNRDKWT